MADRAFDTMSCVSTHVPETDLMSDSDTPRKAITSRLSHKRKNHGPGWHEKNRKRAHVRAWYEFNGCRNKEQGEHDQSEVALPGLKDDEIIEKESAPTKEDKKQTIEDALVKEIPEEI